MEALTRQTSASVELHVIGLTGTRPLIPVAVRVRHEEQTLERGLAGGADAHVAGQGPQALPDLDGVRARHMVGEEGEGEADLRGEHQVVIHMHVI